MSDDSFKFLKEEIIKEFDSNSDMTEEEWQSLNSSDQERAALLHVFKCYDYTVLDGLLSKFDELKEVSLSYDQIMEAWRTGQQGKTQRSESEE